MSSSRAISTIALLLLTLSVVTQCKEKQLSAKSYLHEKGPTLQVEKWLTDPAPDTRGKFVLIDFWATWCPPCLKTIPRFNHFQEVFQDRLVVIGISDENEDQVGRMKNPVIQYASAIDTQARMKRLLEVSAVPHVILMDPDGIVRWEGAPSQEGFELTREVLEDILSKYGKP